MLFEDYLILVSDDEDFFDQELVLIGGYEFEKENYIFGVGNQLQF